MPLTNEDMRAARLRALEGGGGATDRAVSPGEAAPAAPAAAAPEDDTANDSFGDVAELSITELSSVRRLLWDFGAPEDDRRRWHRQGFVFCSPGEGPSFGLQQVCPSKRCESRATEQKEMLT